MIMYLYNYSLCHEDSLNFCLWLTCVVYIFMYVQCTVYLNKLNLEQSSRICYKDFCVIITGTV